MNSGMVTKARDFLHRHWRRALRWREKLVLNEEAFHLVLAGLVGVMVDNISHRFIATTTLAA